METVPTYNAGGYSGLDLWQDGAIGNRLADIGVNTSGSTLIIGSIHLPTDLEAMNPSINAATITRWTAPSTGSWSITGLFQGLDTAQGSHNVEIVENNSTVLLTPTTISSFGQQVSFSYTVTLNAGDTINFDVDGTSTGDNLTTGLEASINPAGSAAPEPASLMLFGIGLAVMGGCTMRRKRRSA